jgi:hypothetical protein
MSLYKKKYKNGFEYFINKHLLKLKKPKKEIKIFYVVLILMIIILTLVI